VHSKSLWLELITTGNNPAIQFDGMVTNVMEIVTKLFKLGPTILIFERVITGFDNVLIYAHI